MTDQYKISCVSDVDLACVVVMSMFRAVGNKAQVHQVPVDGFVWHPSPPTTRYQEGRVSAKHPCPPLRRV